MNNAIAILILLPMMAGILMIFTKNHPLLSRGISLMAPLLSLYWAADLYHVVRQEGIQVLHVGGWLAPHGITLVADPFSLLLVIAADVVIWGCLWFGIATLEEKQEKMYIYPYLMFLLTGVSGAFLTGDIFNLFVFYEVMLISSYALIVFGGERKQLRDAFTYLVINMVASTLFVAAVGYLYAVLGTLNMADLALKLQEVGPNSIISAISVLFLFVFGLKAALFPLFVWLPDSYSRPPILIAAVLGALLTKVGAYSIYRMYTLVFVHDESIFHLLLVLAALTMLTGAVGSLSTRDIRLVTAYSVVASIGFILVGVGLGNDDGMAGGIYYLLQDMVLKAALFLIVACLIHVSGTTRIDQMGGIIRAHPALGWLSLVTILSLVGIPPLSAFVGKVLLLKGSLQGGSTWLLGAMLVSSFLLLYALLRIFVWGIWGEARQKLQRLPHGMFFPAAGLVLTAIFLGMGAAWILPLVQESGALLINSAWYIEAVLTAP